MITTEERKRINSLQDLVGIQSKKSLGVLINTAEVLKRNGFEEESRLLSGKQTCTSHSCAPVYCCTCSGSYGTCMFAGFGMAYPSSGVVC